MDLRAFLETPIELKPLERALVPTGLFLELPVGYEAQVRPRSGLAAKRGVTVLNSPARSTPTIAAKSKVILVNLSNETFRIEDGERVAQLVVARHERVEWTDAEELSLTDRGTGGSVQQGK